MGSRIPLDSTSAQPGRGEEWRRRVMTGGKGAVPGGKPGSDLWVEGVVVDL